eukprot:1136145-Amphidinium_carterae.1
MGWEAESVRMGSSRSQLVRSADKPPQTTTEHNDANEQVEAVEPKTGGPDTWKGVLGTLLE